MLKYQLFVSMALVSMPAGLLASTETAESSAKCGTAAGESGSTGCGCGSTQRDAQSPPRRQEASEEARGFEAKGGSWISWLPIPGGSFNMGDARNLTRDGEAPVRRVTVSPFELQDTEVSNEQFHRFVLATGFITEAERFGDSFVFQQLLSPSADESISEAVADAHWWLPVKNATWFRPEGPESGSDVREGRLDHPVVQVSWNDATAFCGFVGGRLPTEAEWEFAVRGGKEGKLYPWGNSLMPQGQHRVNIWQGKFPDSNTEEDGFSATAPVRSFPPQNHYGLFNMVGNVWEWVADNWTAKHSTKEQTNPRGPTRKSKNPDKVKRGGSYMCHESYCFRYRCSARHYNSADSTASNLGFRCARDANS